VKLHRLLTNSALAVILGACALAASLPAHAGTIWANLNWYPDYPNETVITGSMGSIGVTYTGPNDGAQTWSEYEPWLAPGGGQGSWIGGPVTSAPPTGPFDDYVGLNGGTTETETFTFSSPVHDPFLAIWSLGDLSSNDNSHNSCESAAGSGTAITSCFVFTSGEPFIIVAGGPDEYYGGSSIYTGAGPTDATDATCATHAVCGNEGNGVIEFLGTYSSITFTTPSEESFYIGDPGYYTPEPETLSLLGLGLLALPLLRASLARRRRRA